MGSHFDILKPQVDNAVALIETLKPHEKPMMRSACQTTIERAYERDEITREQREKLIKILRPIDIDIDVPREPRA